MKQTTKTLLAIWIALIPGARAQEKAAEKAPEKAETILIVFEAFSLPLTEAAAILRSGINDKDFYTKMVDGVRAQKITQEMFLMGRTNSGQNINIRQVALHTYNTEAEPPELPNQVAGGASYQQDAPGNINAAQFPVTPATPTSFDKKLLGQGVELKATYDTLKTDIELALRASDTKLIQRDSFGQGVSKIEMPRFSNQQLQTKITAKTGEPAYLGTISAPEELQPKEGEERVWFAFIKATIVSQ